MEELVIKSKNGYSNKIFNYQEEKLNNSDDFTQKTRENKLLSLSKKKNFKSNFKSNFKKNLKNNQNYKSTKKLLSNVSIKENNASILRNEGNISVFENQRTAKLKNLIHEPSLKKIIKENPWEISVQKTISDFKKRIYDSAEIKFRIGGRVIYSTSQIVRAKSNLVIQESHETQDEIEINELEVDDIEECNENFSEDPNIPTMGDILGALSSNNQNSNNNIQSISENESLEDYIQKRDQILKNSVSPHSFYRIDKNGQHFIASPVRKSYRRVDFADLGKALIKTLNYQIKSPKKLSKNKIARSILPENILKKAEEERALVELQIKRMFNKIIAKFDNKEPIAFLSLILSPEPDGIVRTLLYLLQLVNRKHIQIWQKIDEDNKESSGEKIEGKIYISYEETTGLNIFISPIRNAYNYSTNDKK